MSAACAGRQRGRTRPIRGKRLGSLSSRFAWAVLLLAAASAAFAQGEVNVVCSVPLPWCEALAAAYLRETGTTVNLTVKTPGDALAQLAAERDDPRHDVWYAGTAGMHVQAAGAGLTEEYRSRRLPELADWAVREAERSGFRAVGVHAAALGIAYNTRALAQKRLPEPRCWADLARAEYRDEVEVPNPISSRTAYTALATLVQLFGEERAFELLRGIHRNVKTYQRTGAGPIRAAARGETTVAVAWLHDAVTEIANGFPIRLVVPCEGASYEVYAMSIIHGTPRMEGAKRFYDWALGVSAQRIGGQMKYFRVPSNKAVPVPAVAPNWSEIKLVPIDFVRFQSASEQRRLLERWDREVHAAPR